MNSFWLAVQFLTRLPTPPGLSIEGNAVGRSALYYPLVGALIGLLLALAGHWLDDHNAWLAAALVLSLWVIVTGGLHLDGLADSADAWAGAQGDRERCLAIMKDPYAGPAGVSAIVLVLLLKFAALGTLFEAAPTSHWWLAPLMGRCALLVLPLALPYVRPQGLGRVLSAELPRGHARQVLLATAILTLLIAGWNGMLVLAGGGVAMYLLIRALRSRLGGTTGDTLGAGVEITETLTLLSLALTAGG